MTNAKKFCKVDIEIPFPSSRIALVAYDVLRVDKEPKRSEVVKTLSVRENILLATFSAPLAKHVRVSINGFLDKVDLISGTIELLGQPVNDTYLYY